MTQNENVGNEKEKKKNGKTITFILVPFIFIIIAGACFIAILSGIVDQVINVMVDIFTKPDIMWEIGSNAVSNSVSFAFDIGAYQDPPRSEGFKVFLSDEEVNTLKENLRSQAIETEKAGLTDILIKKMILINYMTSCTIDTEIVITLSESDFNSIKKEIEEKGEKFSFKFSENDIPFMEYNDGIFRYWSGDGKKDGEIGKFYISVKGIIRLLDEKGETIYPYNNAPNEYNANSRSDFDKIAYDCKGAYEENKNDYGNEARNRMKCAYTITNLGSIKMNKVQVVKGNTVYSYGEKEIISEEITENIQIEPVTIELSQYISQYAMPIDFLVSMEIITGSDQFIEAVCELVGKSKIELIVSGNDVYSSEVKTSTYNDDITIEGIQEIKNKSTTSTTYKDGRVETKESETNSYQNVSVTATASETKDEGEDYNVKKEITKNIKDINYEIYVNNVDIWYCKAEYDITTKLVTKYTFVDEEGNEIIKENEYESENLDNNQWYYIDTFRDIGDNIDKYRIWRNKDDENKETQYATDYENSLKQEIISEKSFLSNISDKDEEFRRHLINEASSLKNFFRNENLKLEKEDNDKKKDSDGNKEKVGDDGKNNNDETSKVEVYESNEYSKPGITKVIEKITNEKESQINVTVDKVVSNASTTTNYEDNTDKFLGLLKNETGTYVKGASFKSNGKKVVYKDIYNGNATVGDLLVNGSDMLFQLMESSLSNSKGLVNVIKYILYRYTDGNSNFGVTRFDINWMDESSFSSVGSGSAQGCWKQFLGSYEGTNMTKDGQKYLLLDGGENDAYHNISTAYGLKFYEEEDYYDIGFQAPFNQAFKDCNINLTLKEALKDLIVNGKVQYQLANSNYEFPEKYALPKEVVDKAMDYILSSKEEEIKQLVDRYNKENGKNLSLTTEQIQAIADGHWQHVDFDCYEFIKAYGDLKDGVNDKNIDSLRSFSPFRADDVYGRGNPRWKLFTEGVYTLKDGTVLSASSANGKIAESAIALVEETKMGARNQALYGHPRRSISGYSTEVYVCASFVSEAVYNATGFRKWDNLADVGRYMLEQNSFELIYYDAEPGHHPTASDFSKSINLNMNFEQEMQPGDIVASFDNVSKYPATYKHILIYLGNGKYAHHGGGGWSSDYNGDQPNNPSSYPNISEGFFTWYDHNNIKYIIRYKGN